MDKDLKEVVRVAKNNGAESKYLAGISFEKEEKYKLSVDKFLQAKAIREKAVLKWIL